MRTRLAIVFALLATLVAGFLWFLRTPDGTPDASSTPAETPLSVPPRVPALPIPTRTATADLQPIGGSGVSGTLSFVEIAGTPGLRVDFKVKRLSPGPHTVYVGGGSDCTSTAGSPVGAIGEPRFAGDLGELSANAVGYARGSMRNTEIALGGNTGIDGSTVWILNQPGNTTNARSEVGHPVACGVVRVPQPG